MKGVDVSEEQLASVRQFLREISRIELPDENTKVAIRFGDYLRTIAWYAAIKKGGDGSGMFVNRTRETVRLPVEIATQFCLKCRALHRVDELCVKCSLPHSECPCGGGPFRIGPC